MARPGGLGKGLGALIPAAELSSSALARGLAEIPVNEISPVNETLVNETTLDELPVNEILLSNSMITVLSSRPSS